MMLKLSSLSGSLLLYSLSGGLTLFTTLYTTPVKAAAHPVDDRNAFISRLGSADTSIGSVVICTVPNNFNCYVYNLNAPFNDNNSDLSNNAEFLKNSIKLEPGTQITLNTNADEAGFEAWDTPDGSWGHTVIFLDNNLDHSRHLYFEY